jgi:hypothetical protein
MSKSRLARSSAAAAVFAILGMLVLGVTTAANADALIFSASNVNVKVTGGDAIALNNCINDARDGVIQTQLNACNQVASAGNIVQLDDSSIWVFANGFTGLPLFSHSHVTVELTGGLMNAINSCVNDAQDGVIQTQQNACAQSSTAGSIVALTGVTVAVFQ